MTTQYIVRIRNRAGARQYDVTDFLRLDYSKYVNSYGTLNVDLPGNHAAIDTLEKDGQIEIWRFDGSQAGYCDFYGLYRDRDRNTPRDNKNGIFRMKCVGQSHYLWRAVTGHASGTNLRNDFTAVAAETVMKNLVKYNCTASATLLDGRKRVPTWASLITTQADSASGSSITKAFAHRKVGDALQEVAALSGMDFDLIKTGARTWEFRTYAQLGSDLSGNIKFSLAWDNLDEPQLVGNALDEETVAMTWGTGEGSGRAFSERHGVNYVADYNDIEAYVNAANQVTGSLDAAGDAYLYDKRARDDFNFNILQSIAFRYGRDYCIGGVMGDLVSVAYYEGTATKRIKGAHVVYANSSSEQNPEQIRLDMVTAL